MKHIVIPALSLALLAAAPAYAETSAQPYLQIARDKPHDKKPGDVAPSPAVVPAGQVGGTPAGHGRGHGAATTTGGGQTGGTHTTGHNRGTGTATTTGGGATTGGTTTPAGRGTARGLFTGGQGTGTPTAPAGGTGATNGRGHGGTGTGATGIDRTGGGILTGGTPSGGRGTGGVVTGGGHGGATVFGRRPPNWNQYPRTFNRSIYQRNFTAPRRFHWNTYRRPQGWFSRRWMFGQILPNIFWTNDYWLTDYWMFDLPVPPYGYVWVRYGDDALLINKRTGEVLEVVYGLFD